MRSRDPRIAPQDPSDPASQLAALAKITREWGVRGELKALPLSDKLTLLKPGDLIILVTPGGTRSERLSTIRMTSKGCVISLEGIRDTGSAAALRNAIVAVKRDEIPLVEGEYFYEQIIGLKVVAADGEAIGVVSDIFSAGSSDVYVVRKGGRELLIPAIRDVIREIDLAAGTILIEKMPGLLD